MNATAFSRAAVAVAVLAAVPFSQAATEFKFGGYVKTDVIVSDYSEGAPADNNVGRDFYVPGTLLGGDKNRDGLVTDISARESRFNLSSKSDINGHKLKSFFEVDFLTHSDGDERISNSYSPRLRHAFVSYDKWMMGQTWSTFQNPGALPEALDFTGAGEGTVFMRQAQVRYSNGGLQLSIENPQTVVRDVYLNADGQPKQDRLKPASSYIPDVVARYNFNAGDAKISAAAILRQLSFEETRARDGLKVDETETAYGVSVSGIVPTVGKDKFKFMVNYGDGVGRYMALNYIVDAVLTDNAKMETIGIVSGFATYQHWWSDKLRSNFVVSMLEADYDTKPVAAMNESSMSYIANLLYSPIKPVTVGVEYLHASNELTSGADGDMDRFQATFKYAF
ncbi:DcaP family trimeric outer membrane transporter [uncultured Ferrimonas sp.]|uniref:DcaP family trimeric outer membrane transporter n=1 Tax=uncultured Ferrimonas sp. TaxID=432640 RepID=UPI0026342495|nr:DcaP family trimeric outer membrane transporter [uncultured Ferrimonas sp.]